MKFAVISDIHGNLEALTAILTELNFATKIFCLGDIVGYGPNPNECCNNLRNKNATCITGNHDKAITENNIVQNMNQLAKTAILWTKQTLTEENKNWLKTLNYTHKETQIDSTFTHGTFKNPQLFDYIECPFYHIEYIDTCLGFYGHTHKPCIINDKRIEFATNDTPITIKPARKYLINVGSVGQPRDNNPKACYITMDTESNILTFHRTSYDIKTTQKKMKVAKMPPFLITRLQYGR